MGLKKRLKGIITPQAHKNAAITHETVFQAAIQCIEEDSQRTMASGRPDWKAELMACSSARAIIENLNIGNSPPCDYGKALVSALYKGREGYHQECFQDNYSYGPATFGAIASNLQDKLSALGCSEN